MATYIFVGSQPTFFNGLRDPDGKQYGYLEPGEIVDITEPPNAFFVPVDVPQAANADSQPVASEEPSQAVEPVPAPSPPPAPSPVAAPAPPPWAPPVSTPSVVH